MTATEKSPSRRRPYRLPEGSFGESSVLLASASPEEQLLACLCSLAVGQSLIGSALRPNSIDWKRFLNLAHLHRVAPLLWLHLKHTPHPEIPAWVLLEIGAAHQWNAIQCLRIASNLIRVVKALSAAGIQTIPLKGICLAAKYYHDTGARHAGDIDLLIAPEQIATANEVLLANGYVRVSKATGTVIDTPLILERSVGLHLSYVSPDGVLLELHFRLHFNPAALPVRFGSVWKDAVVCPIADLSLSVMSDALQFVFLCTHGARHEWERLQWVCDIAVMVRNANAEDLHLWLNAAKRYKLVNPAIQGLVLANEILGIQLSDEVNRAFSRSLRIRFMVRRARRKILLAQRSSQEPEQGFDPGRRLYRLCVTSSPRYVWNELCDAVGTLNSRIKKSLGGQTNLSS